MDSGDKPKNIKQESVHGDCKVVLGTELTKREAFAMAAMQGLMASEAKGTFASFASTAVNMADALLAALEADNE